MIGWRKGMINYAGCVESLLGIGVCVCARACVEITRWRIVRSRWQQYRCAFSNFLPRLFTPPLPPFPHWASRRPRSAPTVI